MNAQLTSLLMESAISAAGTAGTRDVTSAVFSWVLDRGSLQLFISLPILAIQSEAG